MTSMLVTASEWVKNNEQGHLPLRFQRYILFMMGGSRGLLVRRGPDVRALLYHPAELDLPKNRSKIWDSSIPRLWMFLFVDREIQNLNFALTILLPIQAFFCQRQICKRKLKKVWIDCNFCIFFVFIKRCKIVCIIAVEVFQYRFITNDRPMQKKPVFKS